MSSASEGLGAVHKVRHAILANFAPPPPVTLCHTSRNPPESTSHISYPPIFSRPSTKNPDKSPLYNSLSIVHGAFLSTGVLPGGLLSGMFCPGWFLSVPPSVRIHLLRQKVKHHFKF